MNTNTKYNPGRTRQAAVSETHFQLRISHTAMVLLALGLLVPCARLKTTSLHGRHKLHPGGAQAGNDEVKLGGLAPPAACVTMPSRRPDDGEGSHGHQMAILKALAAQKGVTLPGQPGCKTSGDGGQNRQP